MLWLHVYIKVILGYLPRYLSFLCIFWKFISYKHLCNKSNENSSLCLINTCERGSRQSMFFRFYNTIQIWWLRIHQWKKYVKQILLLFFSIENPGLRFIKVHKSQVLNISELTCTINQPSICLSFDPLPKFILIWCNRKWR